MYISSLLIIYILWILVVVLEQKKEVLDMMIKYGIMDGLCDIFSTSTDENTLV